MNRIRRGGAVPSLLFKSLLVVLTGALLITMAAEPADAVGGLLGGWWAVDLHAHTVVSADARGDLGIESSNARSAGLDGVFLTDHNLGSDFSISGHTANHSFFSNDLTRWDPATFGSPMSTTVALASSPVHSGTASIHIANSGGSGSESSLWTKRAANFLPGTGSIQTTFSVNPVTSLGSGSSLYVSATIGGDATVAGGAPIGYTPAQSNQATRCKSVVLVWYFGTAPSPSRFAPTSTSNCGSSPPPPVVREFPLGTGQCDKAFATGTWITCTIDVSGALSALWSTNPADKPFDYGALSDLKMAASGNADAYFDDYATDKGPLPGTAISRAGDEFALRTSLLPQYNTPGQFMLFPSLEEGQSQHAQRLNFGILNGSQFTTYCAPSPNCSYSLGVDGIIPTEQSGYPGQLNHPGVPGGVSDAQAITNGPNGYAYGADTMEVRDQNMINDWDTILAADSPLVGVWTTDDHSSRFGSGSPVTFLYSPSLTFDPLMRALFEGRAYDATLGVGRGGRFVINLDGSTIPYPSRYPVYVPSSGTGPTVHVSMGGGLSSGDVVRWIVNGSVAFTDPTSQGAYTGAHAITLGTGATAYTRAEIRSSSASLKGTTEPILFRKVSGLPSGMSYHVETVTPPSGQPAYTRHFTKGITATSWNATGQSLSTTLTDLAGSLAEVRVRSTGAPSSFTVDGSTVAAAASLAAFQASTSSSWFYDAPSGQTYLKVFHATVTASTNLVFSGAGDTTPPSAPGALGATADPVVPTINLSWGAASDASGIASYEIRRGTSLIATVTGSTLSYSDQGLAPSTSYSYTVRAIDGAGIAGPDSNTASATTAVGGGGGGLALVQQKVAGGSAATLSATLSSASASGDALVAAVGLAAGGSASVSSVTDSAGGVWTKGPVGFLSGANSRVEMWYRLNASSVSSVTVTLSAAKSAAVNVSEWSGVAAALALDGSLGGGGASSTAVATPSLATTNPTDLVIGAVNYPAGATSTLGSGSFTGLSDFNAASSVHGRAAYAITSAAGSFQSSWTLSALSGGHGAAILALKGG